MIATLIDESILVLSPLFWRSLLHKDMECRGEEVWYEMEQQQQQLGEGNCELILTDADNNLINQLPERQLRLGTSISEPLSRSPIDIASPIATATPAGTLSLSSDEVDLESGGKQRMIRAASYSGDIRSPPHPINSTSFFNLRNFLPMLPPNLIRQPSVPVFYCVICLENHPVSNCFISSTCQHSHQYCQESIKTFTESLIHEGNVMIRCPGYGECQGILTEYEIKNLCEEVVWNKYQRFRDLKDNPNFRECPFCNHPHVGDESHPEITCEKCQQMYCFFHANAHPNIPCHRYTREQLKSQMKSYAFIKSNTRNCPSCSTPTEKNGGCNHMTCQHCRSNWCWLCGKIMESNHFDDPLNGCLGGQFVPPPPFALWTIFPWIRSPYVSWIPRIPALILITAALVVGLGSFLLGACCSLLFLPITGSLLGCLYLADCMSGIDSEAILMFPGILVCGLIGSACFLILELVWLPVPAILSIFLFPSFLLTRSSSDPDRPSVCSYFHCLVEEEISPFWCYPAATIVNGISGLFQWFDD